MIAITAIFTVLILGTLYIYASTDEVRRNNLLLTDISEEVISEPTEVKNYVDNNNIEQDSDIYEIIKIRLNEKAKITTSKKSKYFIEIVSQELLIENTPSLTHNQPAGSIYIEERYDSSWTISHNSGIKLSIIESVLGYSADDYGVKMFQWESRSFPYHTNLKGYKCYEYITYNLYNKSKLVGTVSVKRIIGYDMIVYKNQV